MCNGASGAQWNRRSRQQVLDIAALSGPVWGILLLRRLYPAVCGTNELAISVFSLDFCNVTNTSVLWPVLTVRCHQLLCHLLSSSNMF